MPFTPNITTTLLFFTVLVILLPSETYAFGAGDIPDFAYLNDKAFRHGDIESILEQVVKNAGRAAGGGGLLSFAKKVLDNASGGAKFNKGDVKKVYFGNWLRDYSQAMDIAGLSKLTADTLVLVVSVLGFMTFGFATKEYEVTADRLGVYLPVEHIDNPKGYAEKEGDARQFHPKLRPPVDPRELEIDHRTGMKNYMATEDQGWDSSTAHIRRTFRACIEYGRRSGGEDGADLWEAYRLLGTGLHTMEDLLAHSNWCEIALRKMGHSEVFCHVGENTDIDTPNGRAPPLVTGTFGSADFLHSLLGEATDHLSQASVTSLSEKMNEASSDSNSSNNIEKLKSLFSKLPIGGGDDAMSQGEQLQQESKAYNFDPDDVAPPEVQKQLFQLLQWRDDVYRSVMEKIEMVPGLSDLLDELTNALNAYVYTVIAPWLTPILTQATSVLGEGSKAVIDSDDQYEVFNNADASDPSHSLLSKDHFGLILNEPAGKIAQIVVVHSVQLIVQAWADNSDPDQVINEILEAFHHPYYADGRSAIQHKMFEEMERWVGGLGPDEAEQTIQALTKDSVRNGKNKRLGDEDDQVEPGYGGGSASQTYQQTQGRVQGGGGAYGGGYDGGRGQQTQYGGNEDSSYQRKNDSYSSRRNEDSYGRSEDSSYQRKNDDYSSRRNEDSYGGSGTYKSESYSTRRDNDEGSYGSSRNTYGQSEGYGSRRDEEPSYGSGRGTYGQSESYTSRREEEPQQGYGSRRDNYGDSQGYGGRKDESGDSQAYGSQRDEYSSRSERASDQYGERRSGYGDSEGYGRGEGRGDYNPRNEQQESGYSGRYESQREERSEFESRGQREEYGGGEYGGGRERENYGEERGGFGGEEYGGGREVREGYGGGGGYERPEDDTFGAERLNIRDEGGYGGGNEYSRDERREYDY